MKKSASIIPVVLFLLTSCGGGSSAPGGVGTVAPPLSVAISPGTQLSIDQGQTVKFTASVANDSNSKGVSWSVSGSGCSGSGCGTLANTSNTAATYDAPGRVTSLLTVTVKATSVAKGSASASAVLKVAPPPAISTSSLPDGVVGTSYNATLQASGGTGSLSWSLAPGSELPDGLLLDAATGGISGTPLASGTSNFSVQVTDSASTPLSTTQSFSIVIAARLIVTTALLPPGTVNLAYSATLQASGGTAPYSWAISSGSLPVGLFLDGSTGVISGTPTTSQTSDFSVRVTDSSMQTTTQQLSITIDPALVISTTALADGTVNVAYSTTVEAAYASLPVSWSLTPNSKSLPTGLSLDSSTGVISGTPTATGTSDFTVMVTDSTTPTPQTATQSLSITINGEGANNTELFGHYAFLLSGYGAHGNRVAAAGSFQADGAGNITNGVEDVNDTTLPPQTGLIFTGTYSLGADNRGVITFTNSARDTYSIAFAAGALVGGTAEKGSAVEFDASGYLLSGVIEWQDPASFLKQDIKGSYAFGFTGSDMAGSRMAVAGQFSADGTGGITGGVFDADDSGTLVADAPIASTSTYAVDTTTGRCAATLNGISPAPAGYAFYIVSANKMLAISTTNVSSSGLVAGEIDLQSGGPYSIGSLSSSVVLGVDSAVDGGSRVTLGAVTFDGAGNASFSMDDNNAGTITTLSGNGSYTAPDATTGRFKIAPPLGMPGLVGYLVSANQAFVIGADSGVTTGSFQAQSGGPFTISSLNYTGFFGNRPFASATAPPPQGISLATLSTGVATFDGAGNVSLTSDSNESGTLFPGLSTATTYTVSPSGNGRVAVGSGSIYYIVSPTEFVSMSATPGDPNPKLGFGRK